MNSANGLAVVTGAASGIGLAVTRRLSDRGIEVIAWDAQPPEEPGEANQASEIAWPHRYQVVDVSDPIQIREGFESLDQIAGDIDVLVACAGMFESTSFLELEAETWDRTVAVNLRGSVLCAVEAAKRMAGRGNGRIVLVSSVAAAASEPGSCAYSATKAALSSVVRSVAVDVSRFGISVTAVAPGWVETGMTHDYLRQLSPHALDTVNPLGRVGDPTEIADVIAYLSLDAPSYLTGATVVVDGGQLALAAVPS